MSTSPSHMIDLKGYCIIIAETPDGKVKLYGSPADKSDLEIGDEILEVNGKTFKDNCNHNEVITHIHDCIRSRSICLRVKRKSGSKAALDFPENQNVQDAFVIAVEQQARERLERLSALNRIKPVDMSQLSFQLNQEEQSQSQSQSNSNNSPPRKIEEPAPVLPNTSVYVTCNNKKSSSSPNPATLPESGNPSSETCDNPSVIKALTNPSEPVLSTLVNQELDNSFKPSDGLISSGGRRVSLAATSTLKNEADKVSADKRRASTSYLNGQTELLIGEFNNVKNKIKTTAVVERQPSDEEDLNRSIRRQSGGSSIVSDATDFEIVKKKYLDEEEDDEYSSIMRMISGMDSGPHREMAVDVPETFIARTKTPPRYPPPRSAERVQNGIPMTVIQPKPAPPPRDHLKLDKPVPPRNKAPPQPPTSPPPQIPVRNVNNHVPPPPPVEAPTKEQLNSIRKYQEVIRKQKENDDKIAEQNEFLNRSLRGSRKLQVLENKSGVVNDAFSVEDENEARKYEQDEDMEGVDDESEEPETLHKVYNYGETVSAIKRLMVNLKKLNQLEGTAVPESKLQLVQNLILSPEFGRALFLHNAVQQSYSFKSETAIPLTSHLQSLAKESIKVLESCSLPEASECINILEDMDQTLSAHDAIVMNLTPNIMNPVEQPVVSYNEGGATIRNEGDAVIVGRVVKGGLADRTGLLHEGDEILEINGIEIRGKSIHIVCDILVGLTGQEMTMLVLPNPETNTKRTNSRENLMHVIAHFDYDPEDDMYIPCKELGMSFQKGDILHVISQDDPNWWQAYREGEEDHTLAGLIPSRSFQYQREQLKRSINSDITDKDKSTSPIHFFSSNFLCSKSKQKLKKKKSANNAPFGDGNYPLYSSSATDFDVDEILTYEEVSLYYPRSNEKRPIVLIGPPNIGRHELRQRLMEDSDRFAAAIPHTSRPMKDGEVDGQDYHFITRAQFELDILARKFIEHGEYEKSYYGTSLDAIRTVVNAGKICVLNLHPQSLKILRSSDLKPFVIFVAPPPFELLKQKRIRRGDNFKDEDLKDTIEKAREMEEKYGKYFDMVIINQDNESSYQKIIEQVNNLEREPQWVPSTWVKTA
ncbi:hypothetical protein M8J76_005360 [Diaphorina citri]|nr:hypothetical protein M8J76_005360 [Diaphorina citri]